MSRNTNFENYDPSFPDQPVIDLYLPIWANLPAFRSKPAFIWAEDDGLEGSAAITYAQLNDAAQSVSSQLQAFELQRGDTVLVLCSPGLDLVEILFGCQRAGLLSVPIYPPSLSSPNKNLHQLSRALSQTKPKIAIAHRNFISQLLSSSSGETKELAEMVRRVRWIFSDEIRGKSSNRRLNYCQTDYDGCKPEETYLVQYTSGATGIPKPVLVSAGSAAHNARTARKAYDLQPNSVIMSWLPQYHDCGLMFLMTTVVSGATCVLTSPSAFVNRPRIWLELISEFRATCTPVPLFTLPLVLKRGGIDKGTKPINLQSLKNLIIINEPLYRAPVEEFVNVFQPYGLNPSSISPSYGLAENCTFVSTAWRPRKSKLVNDFPFIPAHKQLLPSARLSSLFQEDETEDMEIVVVNEETGDPLDDGVEGEIWVSSPSNAEGYLGHPSLTEDVFRGRLSAKVGRRFVRTGDRGIVRGEERFLYVTGRCSDVIKLHGDREIHPHYVEYAAYTSCTRLLRGGCLAAFKVSETIVLVAEMQMKERDGEILGRLCEGMRKSVLAEHGIEIGLLVLVDKDSVSKTTSGKIQRWAAKNELTEGRTSIVMSMRLGNDEGSSLKFEKTADESQRGESLPSGKSEEQNHSLLNAPARPLLLSPL